MLGPRTNNLNQQTRLQFVKNDQSNQNNSNNSGQALPPPQNNNQSVQRPCLWFVISWILFLIAAGIYVGIWAISSLAVKIQASPYYSYQYNISPYLDAEQVVAPYNCVYQISSTAQKSNTLYTESQLKDAKAIALSLIFSWLQWKLPMAMFMLHLIIQSLNNKIAKFVTWAVAVLIMVAADILLTIFIPAIYRQYMFYALTTILTVIVSLINNRPFYRRSIAASLLPLFFIAFLYFSYSYFIPALFNLMVKNVTYGYEYIMIYGFPFLDLIFYAGLLILNRYGNDLGKPILSFIQFFQVGYFCGITLLAGVIEVEFYYLVAYLFFRNFFTNWVMWNWDTTVNNPPCLPGWGILYYISYLLNFLPVIGVGPLVISKSFYSTQFGQSCLLLYNYPDVTNSFPSGYNVQTPTSGYNLTLRGYIFWPAALIIWFFSTISQKYPRRKPTIFDLFYNLAGIYMFYLGISAGLELRVLAQVVFQGYQ